MEVSDYENIIGLHASRATLTNESNQLFLSISSDYEKLFWVLDNFPNFTKDTTWSESYALIEHCLLKHYNEIPEEHHALFHGVLTELSISIYPNFSPKTKQNYSMALVAFVLFAFPDIWPEAFDFIVQIENPEIIDLFFFNFLKSFSVPVPCRLATFAHIRESINVDLIKEVIFTRMNEKSANAFNALAYFSYSIDPSWIADESLVAIFAIGVEDGSLTAPYINILSKLMSSLTQEDREQIYESFTIPDVIEQLITQCTDSSILMSAGRLLLMCGKLIPEDFERQLTLALEYFSNESDEVTSTMIPLIQQEVYEHKEYIPSIIPVVVQRLASFYEANPRPTKNQLPSGIARIITNCLRESMEEAVPVLIEIFSEDLSQNLPLLATLFCIIFDFSQMKLNIADMFAFISTYYEAVLGIDDPITEETYWTFYNFLKLPVSCSNIQFFYENQCQNISQIVARIVTAIFADGVEDDIKTSLVLLLTDLSKIVATKGIALGITAQDILNLIDTMNSEIIKAASYLQVIMTQEEVTAFYRTVFAAFEAKKTAENEEEILLRMYDFIQSTNPSFVNAETATLILEFLAPNIAAQSGNPQICGYLLELMAFTGLEGFPTFCEMFSSLDMSVYCKEMIFTALNYNKLANRISRNPELMQHPNAEAVQSSEWVNQFLTIFFPVFIDKLNAFLVTFPSNALNDLFKILKCGLLFFSNVPHLIPEEVMTDICAKLGQILEVMYENIQIIASCANFITSIYIKYPASNREEFQMKQIVAFTKRSMLFVLNANFDPNLSRYEKFLSGSIAALHKAFSTNPAFVPVLNDAIVSFGAPEEFTQSYLETLKKDPKLLWPSIRQFYTEFIKFKTVQSWHSGTDYDAETSE